MVPIGSKPDLSFTVNAVIDGQKKQVVFKDLMTGPTVVTVYMKNNTSVCDAQNQSLAAQVDAFAEKGYGIISVGKDTCASHIKYAQKLGITYILVSDPDMLFAQATDSLIEKSMYGKKYMGPTRSAYVFDAEGTVKGIIEKVDSENHAAELLALI
jgi:thioredoxin-dependent peroxiredoxin